jgi:hypothetical protein
MRRIVIVPLKMIVMSHASDFAIGFQFLEPKRPQLSRLTPRSLDDPSVFKPQAVLYASQGHAWDHLNPELPKFEKLPPRD